MEEFVKYTNLITGILSLLFVIKIQLDRGRSFFSKKILSVYFLLFFSFWVLSFLYFSKIMVYEVVALTSWSLNLVFYPLFFIYLKSLTVINYKFKKIHLFYFSPFIFFSLIFLFYFIKYYLGGIYIYEIDHPVRIDFRQTIKLIKEISLRVNLMQFSFFVIYMFIILKKHRIRIKEYFSYEKNISLKWFNYFLLFLIIFWVFDTYYDFFIKTYSNSTFFLLNLRFLLNILHVFYIGVFGLNQSPIYNIGEEYSQHNISEEISELTVIDNADSTGQTEKYFENFVLKDSGKSYSFLDENQKHTLMEKIDKLMEEKQLYRNPELNIFLISRELFTNTKYISVCINEIKKMNFQSYVNTYRIKEAMLLMENKNQSIQEIMETCGFNSRSSFNQYFKKMTGLTPSEYRKQRT